MLAVKSLAVVVVFSFSFIALGQSVGGGVTPVPPWTGGKGLPPGGEKNNVFIDLSSNEIVVLSPKVEGQSERQILRIPLQSSSDVSVKTDVTASAKGYVYDYWVELKGTRSQPLFQWQLLIPAEPDLFIELPAGWDVERAPAGMPDRQVGGPGMLEYATFTGRPGRALRRGDEPLHFRLISRSRPGYVTSFARSVQRQGASLVEAMAVLDASGKVQVETLLRPEWNSVLKTVLGPRFTPGTPPFSVIATLNLSVQRLTVEGLLRKDSALAKEVLSILQFRLDGGRSTAVMQADIQKLPSPQDNAEEVLWEVLRLNAER